MGYTYVHISLYIYPIQALNAVGELPYMMARIILAEAYTFFVINSLSS